MKYATYTNPHTDPSLTPAQRGEQSAWSSVSCDYNPNTDEYNPYPLGSSAFSEYSTAFEAAIEAFKDAYPHA